MYKAIDIEMPTYTGDMEAIHRSNFDYHFTDEAKQLRQKQKKAQLLEAIGDNPPTFITRKRAIKKAIKKKYTKFLRRPKEETRPDDTDWLKECERVYKMKQNTTDEKRKKIEALKALENELDHLLRVHLLASFTDRVFF